MDSATIYWGVLFGSVGTGYAIYGKKQQKIVPTLCGVGLIVFPYLVEGTWPTLLVGVTLLAVPYFIRM
ncbi:MAG TPA: hypothetical protein VJ505_02895 [Holophagaceae bacterium]|nr:hypothetical protein [Holophagaceae bacterium]